MGMDPVYNYKFPLFSNYELNDYGNKLNWLQSDMKFNLNTYGSAFIRPKAEMKRLVVLFGIQLSARKAAIPTEGFRSILKSPLANTDKVP